MNLIFIHGAGGSSRVWRYQNRHFSEKYEVTALELPGHGSREGEGRDSIADYVEDVKNEVEDLDNVVMIGHSMGGAITMSYALKYPLKGCVLAGTGARLRVLPAILERITENYEETIDFILEYAIHRKTEKIMKQSREEMLNTSPEVVYRDFLACDRFDMMQEMEKIEIPTLVVCGSQDMLAPVKYSEYLAAKIPFSCLDIIPDCGHMLMLEKPQEFNEVLEKFLTSMKKQ